MLASRRRKQKEGQDEKTGAEIDQHIAAQCIAICCMKGKQQQKCVLEYIVIEGAQKLGHEKWPGAFLADQAELAAA